MLKEKNFFKFFWLIIKYFGLQPHKLNKIEKARAIFYFVILAVTNSLLYFIALIKNDDKEARINVLQTFPFLILMIVESSNFTRNQKKLKRF